MKLDPVKQGKISVYLQIFVEAARKLNYVCEIIDPLRLIQIEGNGKSWYIYKTRIPVNNSVSCILSKSKTMTAKFLREAGFPAPKHELFEAIEPARVYFQENCSRRLVIKPDYGIGGDGVSMTTDSVEQFDQAFLEAKKFSEKVVIEDFVPGKNYRVLVIGGKVIGVALRLAAQVTGNGTDTIAALVEAENSTRKIRSSSKIDLDEEVNRFLGGQNKSLETIPAAGEIVPLRSGTNLSTGGFTIDVTGQINPETADMILKAVKVIGLDYAGVDIITQDLSVPLSSANGIINEINFNPGLRIHQYAIDRGERDVAAEIIKYIAENYEPYKFI
jgi:cyanophycin synthetase